MHFERRNVVFKMHKIIFFPEKKNKKKYVCLPYIKFSYQLQETHLFFFILPKVETIQKFLVVISKVLKWNLPINDMD